MELQPFAVQRNCNLSRFSETYNCTREKPIDREIGLWLLALQWKQQVTRETELREGWGLAEVGLGMSNGRGESGGSGVKEKGKMGKRERGKGDLYTNQVK